MYVHTVLARHTYAKLYVLYMYVLYAYMASLISQIYATDLFVTYVII